VTWFNACLVHGLECARLYIVLWLGAGRLPTHAGSLACILVCGWAFLSVESGGDCTIYRLGIFIYGEWWLYDIQDGHLCCVVCLDR